MSGRRLRASTRRHCTLTTRPRGLAPPSPRPCSTVVHPCRIDHGAPPPKEPSQASPLPLPSLRGTGSQRRRAAAMTQAKAPTNGGVAIVLSGAGARGAYEAGALSVLLPFLKGDDCPRMVLGTSAGALNAAILARTSTRASTPRRQRCSTGGVGSRRQGSSPRRGEACCDGGNLGCAGQRTWHRASSTPVHCG